MQKAEFYVGDKPVVVFDPEIHRKSLGYLRNFDPNHFEYLANVHSARLRSKDAHQAAIALRTSYGIALEAFLALLGATVQAPDCIFGWLDRYKKPDLNLVITGFQGKNRLQTKLKGPFDWISLSKLIHINLVLSDKLLEEKIKSSFALSWQYFAEEYLEKGTHGEFNSAKHGLRLQPGGISVSVGLQKSPITPAPPERMQKIKGSYFGSTVFVLQRIEGSKTDFSVEEISRNWDPICLAGRLRILSMSLNNIVSFLIILNGEDPSRQKFLWPRNPSDFDAIWEPSFELTSLTFRSRITRP
jgi:hypothetical protein